jgi:hypothetical protein
MKKRKSDKGLIGDVTRASVKHDIIIGGSLENVEKFKQQKILNNRVIAQGVGNMVQALIGLFKIIETGRYSDDIFHTLKEAHGEDISTLITFLEKITSAEEG